MPEAPAAPPTAPPAQPTINLPPPSGAPEPAGVPGPLNDAFADLDRMAGTEESGPPKGPPASRKAQEGVKTQGEDKTPPGRDEKGKFVKVEEAPKPEDKPPDKPLPAPELRRAYESLKAKHAALEQENKTLKSRPVDDPEKKTISEQLAAERKRRSELEEEIKFSAYERSGEYKQKYEQPFVDAYQNGMAKAAAFKVVGEDGNVRQGTAEDFAKIVNATDDDVAANLAKELFGETKGTILFYYRERVLELNSLRAKALEEYRKTGSEREKIESEKTSAQQKALNESWKTLNDEAIKKYPQWFQPIEGDEKGNELLTKGYELADLAFNGSKLPPEKLVEIHSAIRNRAAAFGRVVYQNKQFQSKIEALEKELADFKSSEPGSGEGARKNGEEPLYGEAALINYVG